MPRDSLIEMPGKIVATPGGGKYRVDVGHGEGNEVIAQLCGKMKFNKIRVILGDKVVVAVSPYDTKNGLITTRNK